MKRPLEPYQSLILGLTAIGAIYWVNRRCGLSTRTAEDRPSSNFRTYEAYATSHKNNRMWTDRLIERMKVHVAIGLGVIALATYALGLLIAWPCGFIAYYVTTPAVYLGVAGIVLVIGAARWGSLRAHHDYEYLRPVFTVDDATYRRMLDDWFSNLRSLKGVFLSSFLFFVVAFVGLVLAYATSASTRKKFYLEPLRPDLILPAWYSERFKVVGFILLLIFLLLISITIGTGGWLLVRNIIFLSRLRRLPVIPMPTIVRARLRRLANLYVGASLAWSLGVALFGILFYRNYNIVSGMLLGALFIIGLLMFVVPQVICRSHIIRSHEQLCAMCLVELNKDLSMPLQERQPALATQKELAGSLADLYMMSDRPKTSVYDFQNLVFWIGSQLVALAAVLPHSILANFLQFMHL
jgi:hypothetical protein